MVPIPVIAPEKPFVLSEVMPVTVSYCAFCEETSIFGGCVYPKPGFTIVMEFTDPLEIVAVAVAVVPIPIPITGGDKIDIVGAVI